MFTRFTAIFLAALPAFASAQSITWAVSGSTTDTVHNPYTWTPEAELIGRQIFEPLVLKGTGTDFIPVLVESLAFDDGVARLRLKQNVRFHDGGDLDANDIVFSFRTAGEDDSNVRGYAALVEGASALSRYDVEFRYSSSVDQVVLALSEIMIVDSDYFKNGGLSFFGDGHQHLSGTGAFRGAAVNPGVDAKLERFDSYHGAVRHPYQDVNIHVINDALTRQTSLLAGDVDIVDNIDARATEEIERYTGAHVEQVMTDWFFVAETNPVVAGAPGGAGVLASKVVQDTLTNAMGKVDPSRANFRMMADAQIPNDAASAAFDGTSDLVDSNMMISCAYETGFVGDLCRSVETEFDNSDIGHEFKKSPEFRDQADLTMRWRRLDQIRFPDGLNEAGDGGVSLPLVAGFRAIGLKDDVEVELGMGGIPLFSPFAAASDDDDGCDDGCPPSGACSQARILSRQECCPPSGACSQ